MNRWMDAEPLVYSIETREKGFKESTNSPSFLKTIPHSRLAGGALHSSSKILLAKLGSREEVPPPPNSCSPPSHHMSSLPTFGAHQCQTVKAESHVTSM